MGGYWSCQVKRRFDVWGEKCSDRLVKIHNLRVWLFFFSALEWNRVAVRWVEMCSSCRFSLWQLVRKSVIWVMAHWEALCAELFKRATLIKDDWLSEQEKKKKTSCIHNVPCILKVEVKLFDKMDSIYEWNMRLSCLRKRIIMHALLLN